MIIFYVILISLLFTNINNYNVSMWGVNVAKVSISSKFIMLNDSVSAQKISYESSSQSLIDLFYPVSNYHETIIQGDNILEYKKNINQIDYEEKIITYRQNDTTFYDSGKFICNNCHNIFSLLDLAGHNFKEVLDNEFIIDRDGERFKVNFDLKAQLDDIVVLGLNIDFVKGQNYINRKNDIFLWGLFLSDCDRLISIDSKNNKIIKCEFINQLGSLEANLIK